MSATAAPLELEQTDTAESTDPAFPWLVLVWDDPVNLMEYVVYVFRTLFGYSESKARKLMLEVHNEGRSVVANGTKEQCELHVFRLHEFGLWATLQQDTP